MWGARLTAVSLTVLSLCSFLVESIDTPSKDQPLQPHDGIQEQSVNSFQITNVTYSPEGCAGTPLLDPNEFPGSIQITFAQLTARTAPRGNPYVHPNMNTTSCEVTFTLEFPRGWAFTVDEGIVKGVDRFQGGFNGTRQSDYWWTGSSERSFETLFRGPAWNWFTEYDQFDSRVQDMEAICSIQATQSVFTLRNTVSIPPYQNGYGEVTMYDQQLVLQWDQCTA